MTSYALAVKVGRLPGPSPTCREALRVEYRDPGEHHFAALARNRTANRLLKRLKDIRVEVLQVRVQEGVDLKLPGAA